DARQRKNASRNGRVSDQCRALSRKQQIICEERPVHRVSPDVDRTAKTCRALERIQDVDVESRCKLDNFANQGLPRLTVGACIGVWSDNYPGGPDQRERQRQSNDEAQPTPG